MSQKSLTLRQTGFITFSIAILLGIILILISVWPDVEANFYGFMQFTKRPLTSLRCPVLMTTQDRQLVKIKVHNPFDKTLNRIVDAQFSTRLTIYSVREEVELQPGEIKYLSWEVGKENIDLGNFIFVRVFTFPASTLKMSESTCGTFVLKLPFKGGPVIFYTVCFITALCLGLGLWFWLQNSDMSESAVVTQSWQMRFLAIVIAVGVVTSMRGWWLMGIIALALIPVTLSVFLLPRKS